VCRRKILLHYFGEEYIEEGCGLCDNCLHPKQAIEAKEEALIALKAIKALDEQFAATYIIPIIAGRLTPQIKMYRHESLPIFGSGKEQPEHYWNSLIRQLLLNGLLKKDIEEYGVLKFTKAGDAFLKKPKSFPIVLNNLYEDANEDDEEGGVESGGGTGTAVDEQLFDMLKDLRHKEAKKKSLPPFVIFLENSLQDMATLYPTTMEELEKCQGVSKGKALRYGKPFIEMITSYVEEHDIVKPEEFVMRSVVNKSGNKVFLIQNIDKRMPLETIAKNKGWRMDEMLEEMETIAASGTKLRLDYAIDEWLDEYEQEEIIDYFKTCTTSDLKVAQAELQDGDYSWEQLKIMRIKFLSEYGM
jgi:ATP-dependent DNA helicase RecQ